MFTAKHVHGGLCTRDCKAEVWLCRTALIVFLCVGEFPALDACRAADTALSSWKTPDLMLMDVSRLGSCCTPRSDSVSACILICSHQLTAVLGHDKQVCSINLKTAIIYSQNLISVEINLSPGRACNELCIRRRDMEQGTRNVYCRIRLRS